MGNQSPWFLFHVDLDAVNAAVALVGSADSEHIELIAKRVKGAE